MSGRLAKYGSGKFTYSWNRTKEMKPRPQFDLESWVLHACTNIPGVCLASKKTQISSRCLIFLSLSLSLSLAFDVLPIKNKIKVFPNTSDFYFPSLLFTALTI